MNSNEDLILDQAETKRFWEKVNKFGPIPPTQPHLGPCWIWTGSKDMKGYGTVWRRGKLIKATRVSFRMNIGPFPEEAPFACHHCDNPICVNPEHLYAGHFKSNATDSVKRGRWNGAKWSKENRGKISALLKEHIKENPDWVIRGEDKPLAKLTEDQVNRIRAEYSAGSIGVRPLASRYKVSRTLIRMIVSGKIWTHV